MKAYLDGGPFHGLQLDRNEDPPLTTITVHSEDTTGVYDYALRDDQGLLYRWRLPDVEVSPNYVWQRERPSDAG